MSSDCCAVVDSAAQETLKFVSAIALSVFFSITFDYQYLRFNRICIF